MDLGTIVLGHSLSNPRTPLLNGGDDAERQMILKMLRLQVATPLSVLINIAVFLCCATVIHPSMSDLSTAFPTTVTPNMGMMSVIWMAIFVGQIGYCVLLILSRMHQTKELLVNGVGLRLVFVNWIMIIWTILFTLKFWTPSAIVLGILFLFVLWINISLFWFPTHANHPLDTLFIHVPIRLFLLLFLLSVLPQNIFIALDWVYSPDHPERDYDTRATQGFIAVMIVHVLGLLWVLFRRDLFWTIGGVYVCLATMGKRPKPAMIYAALITFAVLYPLFWIAATTYHRIQEQNREGRIALPADDLPPSEQPVAPVQPEDNQPAVKDTAIAIDGDEDPSAVWGQPRR
ncbi:hypothetical protein FRB93_005514 [Tulasnella sp. JGI-2019a]|nr:hypothetical protein FRB93_005514 [Tulasnella sp. JGI-2019a]